MAIFRYPNWRWPDVSGALEDFERARRQMDRLMSVFTGGAFRSGIFRRFSAPYRDRRREHNLR